MQKIIVPTYVWTQKPSRNVKFGDTNASKETHQYAKTFKRGREIGVHITILSYWWVI